MKTDIRERSTVGNLSTSNSNNDQKPIMRGSTGTQLDGTRETLASLRVVVPQSNLLFDGLYEVAHVLTICMEKFIDATTHA